MLAAGMLVVNGLMLLFGERLRRAGGTRSFAALDGWDALIIGFWQCLALIPGISRAGATIVGGLLRGVNHADSAHFSFLIATPIIIGATVLETRHLLAESIPPGVFQLATVAAIVAGITAYLSTWFLMHYFRNHDAWALNPFAYYCIVAGSAAAAWLKFA
jgi:undecaprenyl-diphosphatase